MDKSITKTVEEIISEPAPTDMGVMRDALANRVQLQPDLVLCVQGVRRCGKSTLLRQIAHHAAVSDRSVFVNFEDPRLSEYLDHRLLDELVRLHERRSKQNLYYFLDEIQNVDGWEKWLHIQSEKKQRYFVITGSNSSLLSGKLGSALTGRHLLLELYPFSFGEFKKIHCDAGVADYLDRGGFPRALTFAEPKTLLREYFTDIIERDVRRHLSAPTSSMLIQLAKAVYESMGAETSLRKLAAVFDIAVDTAKHYLDAIEQSYLALSCPYFTYSERKSAVRPKKYYPIDLGLRTAVATRTGLDLGKKLETAVFHALKRKYGKVYYWRGKGEVDFIVDTESGLQPIQVSVDGVKDRHVSAYEEFKSQHERVLDLVTIDLKSAQEYLE